jgi:hypothetical protein
VVQFDVGSRFMVTDGRSLLDGRSLRDVLREQRPLPPVKAALIADAVDALATTIATTWLPNWQPETD